MGNTIIPARVGMASGLAGLATFLTIHAFWITPIWNVTVIGVVIAGAGGVITARCYSLAHRLVPVRPISWLVVFGSATVWRCVWHSIVQSHGVDVCAHGSRCGGSFRNSRVAG
jgi:hypothetical protein